MWSLEERKGKGAQNQERIRQDSEERFETCEKGGIGYKVSFLKSDHSGFWRGTREVVNREAKARVPYFRRGTRNNNAKGAC